MKRLTIGVTGINAGDNPGPGIAVAQSLLESQHLDVEIVGLAYDAMEPGIYMDWIVKRSYIVPYPSIGGEACIERLIAIREADGLDYIIPNLDAELPTYLRYADRLADAGIQSFLPTRTQFRLRGKDRLPRIACEIEVSTPATALVHTVDELYTALKTTAWPVMIKGIYYGAKRAHYEAEAVKHFQHIAAEWGTPVLVQQIVEGEPFNVMGLGDGNGGLLGRVAIRKLIQTELGKIAVGVTVHHKPLLDAAARFVRTTNWRGPFEFECIIGGSTIHLIEINPRFPAWTNFATGVGINLPARMVRRSLGETCVCPTEYPAGKLFVRYTMDLVSDMAPLRSLMSTGENR